MSEQVTMQFGPLELRKTEEGWQYRLFAFKGVADF